MPQKYPKEFVNLVDLEDLYVSRELECNDIIESIIKTAK